MSKISSWVNILGIKKEFFSKFSNNADELFSGKKGYPFIYFNNTQKLEVGEFGETHYEMVQKVEKDFQSAQDTFEGGDWEDIPKYMQSHNAFYGRIDGAKRNIYFWLPGQKPFDSTSLLDCLFQLQQGNYVEKDPKIYFTDNPREYSVEGLSEITSSKVSWRIPDDFTSEKTDEYGSIIRLNDKGELHSLYSPAIEYASGSKAWYQNGRSHREDGPAKERANGDKYWYQNGTLHRTDGPAIEYADGGAFWYLNGKKHRENGPAIEWPDGNNTWYLNGDFIGRSSDGFTDEDFENYKREHNIITSSKVSWRIPDDFTSEETDPRGTLRRRNDKGQFHSLYGPAIEYPNGTKYWYQNGELHRTDGPAVEYADGSKSWYLNGDFLGRSNAGFTDEDFENYKREHNIITSSKVSWRIPDDFTSEETDNSGIIRRRNDKGQLHSLYSPAVEYPSGYKSWYQNGKPHRTDGPAVEYADGSKAWYQNGKIHRTDGPAIEWPDGNNTWCLNGALIGSSSGGFTDEDFENYKREHNIITPSKVSWQIPDDFTSEKTDSRGTLRRRNDKGQLHSLYSPALEYPSGYKAWYQNDKLHRIDGPAVEYSTKGCNDWYQNGKLHRTDGPAMEYADGSKIWYLNGVLIGRSENGFTDEDFENYKREHNIITSSKVSWRVYEDDFTSEKTDEDGTLIRRNDKGQLHSLYSPAIEWSNGDKGWYLKGKLHRTDGPAIELVKGDKAWYQNGKLHREDGPAEEYANGNKVWYLNGAIIGFSEDGFTDEAFEAFENYKREHNIITSSKVSWRIPDDFTSEETDEDGTLIRRNDKGELHSLYSPSVEFVSGTKYWYQNGKRHRTDGPAEEYASGDKFWYQNGKLHRTDGPAVEYTNGGKAWYLNGAKHRTDGPAVEYSDGSKAWYLNDDFIGDSENGFTDEDFENYKREHNITASKLSWRVYEDDFTSEETDNSGIIRRRNDKGQLHSLYSPAEEWPNGDKFWYQNDKLHRTDGPAEEYANGYNAWYQNGRRHREGGPALEYPSGYKYWYQNGKRHREDGPAIEYANGSKSWYLNGKLHRTDGPAEEWSNGNKEWYLNGDFLGRSNAGFTNEDFENYKREHNITASKLSWRVYEDDFASEETDGEGNLLRLDNKGQFHSLYSPALERVDGNKFWYRNNNLHRTDGPAVEYVDGDKSWYLNGVLIGRSENGFTDEDFENYKREHNIITSSKLSWRVYEDDFVSEETDEDGTLIRLNDKGQPHSLHSPAIEWPNGNKYWYQNGTLHRVDGPAIARANGDKYWYLNGKRHRTDGPAMKRTNGGKSWYLNGDFIGRSEDGFTDEAFENYKREHNIITSSKVSWRILDDFTSEETDGDGSIIRRNDKGQLHSLYSPAVEWPNGGKEWFQNGKIHRTDGPAVEHASGNKFWYQNSRRHREDGPAIEYADGDKSWYLNGINIGNSEDGFTDEDFENYKREHNIITSSKVSWRIPDDFTSEKTDANGTLRRRNNKGELHSLYSPAMEYANGDKIWYQNGKLHRTDGPTIEYADGSKFWFQNGELHRTDGPAIEWSDGDKSWYLNGEYIGSSNGGFTDEAFENYKREHNIITPSKVSWRVYEDDFTSEKTDGRGNLLRLNNKGQFHSLYSPAIERVNGDKYWYQNGDKHREDGPAEEYADGYNAWYQNGKLHREDGPAVERVDGTKFWYQNGKKHRTDGPAVEYPRGDKAWYLNGDFIGGSEDGFTDEDFENYKRGHNIITSSKFIELQDKIFNFA